jgi:hypothetical protein
MWAYNMSWKMRGLYIFTFVLAGKRLINPDKYQLGHFY